MTKLGWWHWAWRIFAWWSRLDLDPCQLTAKERWGVVAITVPAAIRAFYLRPANIWLLARLPKWLVMQRLDRSAHHWYRIPNRGAADHVRLRFDIYPVDVDDLVRIEQGQITAVGYVGKTSCEIIFVLPNGELEPDPTWDGLTRSGYRNGLG